MIMITCAVKLKMKCKRTKMRTRNTLLLNGLNQKFTLSNYTSFNYLKMKPYHKVLVLDIISSEYALRHNRITF